ncbi:MAG: AMIN domain-containing protein [Alcanivoracaceae bacterium]|nr:AMIN domain-containing protein [Alcanivoracaceae bacterium]
MKIISTILALCLLPQLLYASVEVKGLRVWTSPEDTKAVIDLSGQVEYKLFQLSNPPRVVVDITDTTLNKKLKLKSNPVIR